MAHAVELISFGSRYLLRAGIKNANFESAICLSKIIQHPRFEIYLDNHEVAPEQEQSFWQSLKLRAEGLPLQYVIGSAEFMGREFKTSPGVFVPRPETEVLVSTLLEERWLNKYETANVLDVGTGCGAIAISLACNVSEAHIFACDICDYALQLTQENARSLGVDIDIVKSDLFSAFRKAHFFSLIVSNPPYISTADLESLPREVQHEPRLALEAGTDGLDYYRRIIPEAPGYLLAGGILALEIADAQGPAVTAIFEQCAEFSGLSLIKDYTGRDRVIIARKRFA
ncbi:MAG: peptide chain release factor N(5)-glutamine methyltransferase [Candidatus Omnitrophota bacterium]